MRISIFGLGYVGAVSLACLGRDGHDVVGVDIDPTKLDLIKSGKSPIVEAGIVELMQEVVSSGRIRVSDDAEDAVLSTDVSFVCVGTPSLPNGSQNLGALVRLAEQVGRSLAIKKEHHTLVVRSTVQPGTVDEVVVKILERESGKTNGRDFSVCFQPEFLREGSSIRDYDNPPMTVVGVQDDRAAGLLRDIFGHLPCEFIETDIRTAETVKYACNAFHALKISFANEVGRICKSIGSDSIGVMSLLCQDKQLNISEAYLRPGFAFGGSCLPKDLRAILHIAKSNDVDVPVLSALLPSNGIHVEQAVNMILDRGERSVGLIGLSFKSGTDDLRESPLVELAERLIGKGLQLKIFDPEVRIAQLMGANRKFIEEVIPHIGTLMQDSVKDAMQGSKTVVVGLQGKEILEDVRRHATSEQFMLDLVGIRERSSIPGEYQGICW